MKKQKTPHDVRGFKIKCVNYVQCPICYGCRNYNNQDIDCCVCAENQKQNICNIKLHRSDLVSKMSLRSVVKFNTKDNENIEFKSYDE